MESSLTVIGIVGSPNRDGRTHKLVSAALRGAAQAGAAAELIQLADHVVLACKDCLPWVCASNKKCSYEDVAFEFLSKKLHSCSALVLGSPIYWWDTSGMVRYFFLKMFRVFARSAPFQGLPAFGIGVAGDTGNGLLIGLRPLYHFFQIMQMRALEPLPVTRFNFDACVDKAVQLGGELVGMAGQRSPFASVEERLLWYENLPYLNVSRMEELRLLAGLAVSSVPDDEGNALARRLIESDQLGSAARIREMAAEVTSVYKAAVKAFDQQGDR
jgi:multimeric flavodoxin WrbA